MGPSRRPRCANLGGGPEAARRDGADIGDLMSQLALHAYAGTATLELTVDRDPKCMDCALRATRGDDAFRFDYIENGPETWQVRVRNAEEKVRS
jgi:hypothetical protein